MSPNAPVALTGLALTGAVLALSGVPGSDWSPPWSSLSDTIGIAAGTWTRGLAGTGTGPIGQTLPDTIMLRPISGHDTYRYAVTGGHRVVVDASTRKVIYVIE